MSSIRVSTMIAAPRDVVWEVLRDIGSHVRWMDDAESIRFTSSRREGVGTTFDCESRLGPLRVTDRMEVIEWKPGRAMTVRHVGVVRGVGRFSLRRRRHGTLFVWREVLRFPWWMGGPLGATVAVPVFRHVWKRNLRNLKAVVEGSGR